ncbi:MAG: hypothetical protein H7Y13_13935 [Sphingobacteriaceae bacterium]|nr:hypothetical protein [Sphingobacteriaceae bacterium]
MKKVLLVLAVALGLASCKKEEIAKPVSFEKAPAVAARGGVSDMSEYD